MTDTMTRKLETRRAKIDTRSFNPDNGTFDVVACVYGVVDEYNTRFVEGCFDEYTAERLPTWVWSHNWDEPLGHAIAVRNADLPNGGRGWIITIQGDFVPEVPRAQQAKVQITSGTMTDVSVGFCRTSSVEAEDMPGVTDITGCECDEVSSVIVGAVPGARVMMSRSKKIEQMREAAKKKTIDIADAQKVLKKFDDNEVTYEEAEEELNSLAIAEEDTDENASDDNDDESSDGTTPIKPNEGDAGDGKPNSDGTSEEDAELDADIEAALALAGA